MFSITDHSNFIPGIEIKTDKGKKGVHLICVFPQKIKIGETYVKSTRQNIYDNLV